MSEFTLIKRDPTRDLVTLHETGGYNPGDTVTHLHRENKRLKTRLVEQDEEIQKSSKLINVLYETVQESQKLCDVYSEVIASLEASCEQYESCISGESDTTSMRNREVDAHGYYDGGDLDAVPSRRPEFRAILDMSDRTIAGRRMSKLDVRVAPGRGFEVSLGWASRKMKKS